MRPRRRVLTAVLAVSLLAAACGGGDDDDEAGGDNPAPGNGTTVAEAKFDPNGVLKYGQDLSGGSVSGRLAPFASTAVCDVLVMAPIYEGLTIKNSGTGELEPGLAESWTIVNPTTVEFKLRQGVKFHDGSPFTAEAVKGGLEKNAAPTSAQTAATLKILDRVEVVDPSTVRVLLKEPAAGVLPVLLSGREGMIVAPSAMATADTKPVGAGPFRFVSQQPGQLVRLEKNPDYYNADEVRLKGIDITNVKAGPPQTTAMLGGDIDMVQTGGVDAQQLERDPAIELDKQPTQTYYKMNWNLGRPPFNNLKFRQAMVHAVDREAIRQAVFRGSGEVASGPFPSSFLGFNPAVKNQYPHDVAKAKQLLTESGETTTSFTAFVPPVPDFIRVGEIIQQQLKAVGINMALQQSSDIVQEYFTQKKQLAAVLLWPPRPDPVETLRVQFTPGNFNNLGEYSNPEINRLVSALRAESDDDKRAPLFKEAMKIVVDQALELPLVFNEQMHAYRTRVGGDVIQKENCQGVDFTKLQINAS